MVRRFYDSTHPDPEKHWDLDLRLEDILEEVRPVLGPPVEAVLLAEEPYRQGLFVL
jgi:hypothetical protein